MKKIVKLCKGIFDALLVLVIVGALVLLLAPRLLGARLLVVLSQSMEPTIPMGAIVVSRTVPASEIEVGDAITFRSPDPADQSALITHRVVELVGSGIAIRFRTQGDAVEEPDLRLVTPQNLVGRVLFSVPFLGFAVHFMRTPLGFILFLGLPAALLVGGEVRSMIRATRKKTASAPERSTLPNVPAPEAGHTQAQPAIQARDVASRQQVQALQAQVEALQAKVAILCQQLAQASPNASRLPASESPHACPHSQQVQPVPSGREASSGKMHAGHPILDRFPTTASDVKALSAPKSTPPTAIERLAMSLSGWAWLGLLANLAAVFLLVNFVLPELLSTSLNVYAAQPLLWTGLAVQAFLCWRYGLESRPPLNVSLVVIAGLIGTFQLALLFGAGLLFGFDRLPGDLEILTLMGNLVSVGTMLIGMEISRAYLVALFHRRHLWLTLTLLSLLFSLVSLPPARFEGMDSATSFFQAAGEALLPTFSQNLLASLLAVLGGPVASLAYRAPLLAFEWLSPAHPDQKWVVTALLGSLIPILSLPVVRWHSLCRLAREKNAQTDKERSSAMWARVWMHITPLVTGGVRGITRTLRGHKPNRAAEAPLNPQGR